jgi:hypothetical protein
MKEQPDINDTLRTEGVEAARARHDSAWKYQRNGNGDTGDSCIEDAPSIAPDALFNGNTGEPGSGTWADPDFSILDDRRGTLPEFPIDIFSPECQGWLKRGAAGAGATVDHVAVPLITVVSSLIGTACQVEATRSWRTPLTT